MSKVILWSDLHLGHDAVVKWRAEFDTAEEHHETLFENLRVAVNKRDTLILLGDIAFTKEWLHKVIRIPAANKHTVLGNHDTQKGRQNYGQLYAKSGWHVHGMMKKNGFWFTHAPVHEQELRECRNIHGHSHFHNIKRWSDGYCGPYGDYEGPGMIDDDNYINICPEQTDWKPVKMQDIVNGIFGGR